MIHDTTTEFNYKYNGFCHCILHGRTMGFSFKGRENQG